MPNKQYFKGGLMSLLKSSICWNSLYYEKMKNNNIIVYTLFLRFGAPET
jgi:hypothetical protein